MEGYCQELVHKVFKVGKHTQVSVANLFCMNDLLQIYSLSTLHCIVQICCDVARHLCILDIDRTVILSIPISYLFYSPSDRWVISF